MDNIDYPYMPKGRSLKYVPADNPFMVEAARARKECAGDPLFPVGAVLVCDGKVIARSGNGYNRGPGQVHVCPRIVLGCSSGTGYDLCDLHDSPGHAEPSLMKAARDAGVDPEGADVYMYGHWWCCEPCWNSMIDAGVRDVYVTDDAHERFSRDRVYAQTLSPSVKSVSLDGFDDEWRRSATVEVGQLGLEIVDDLADVHCCKTQEGIECMLKGGKDAVYSIVSENCDQACRQLKNVLKQL